MNHIILLDECFALVGLVLFSLIAKFTKGKENITFSTIRENNNSKDHHIFLKYKKIKRRNFSFGTQAFPFKKDDFHHLITRRRGPHVYLKRI